MPPHSALIEHRTGSVAALRLRKRNGPGICARSSKVPAKIWARSRCIRKRRLICDIRTQTGKGERVAAFFGTAWTVWPIATPSHRVVGQEIPTGGDPVVINTAPGGHEARRKTRGVARIGARLDFVAIERGVAIAIVIARIGVINVELDRVG